MFAAEAGDDACVSELAKQNVIDLNKINQYGDTALHLAILATSAKGPESRVGTDPKERGDTVPLRKIKPCRCVSILCHNNKAGRLIQDRAGNVPMLLALELGVIGNMDEAIKALFKHAILREFVVKNQYGYTAASLPTIDTKWNQQYSRLQKKELEKQLRLSGEIKASNQDLKFL